MRPYAALIVATCFVACTDAMLNALTCSFIIQSACLYWHCPHSMQSRVCASVVSGARPSVCLSVPAWVTAAKFAALDRRYRSIAARRTAAQRAAGECEQCHVVSVYV